MNNLKKQIAIAEEALQDNTKSTELCIEFIQQLMRIFKDISNLDYELWDCGQSLVCMRQDGVGVCTVSFDATGLCYYAYSLPNFEGNGKEVRKTGQFKLPTIPIRLISAIASLKK